LEGESKEDLVLEVEEVAMASTALQDLIERRADLHRKEYL